MKPTISFSRVDLNLEFWGYFYSEHGNTRHPIMSDVLLVGFSLSSSYVKFHTYIQYIWENTLIIIQMYYTFQKI